MFNFLRKRSGGKNEIKQIQFTSNKSGFLSPLFFFLTLCFTGLGMAALNRELGNIIPERSILFFISILGIAIAYAHNTSFILGVSLITIIFWWGFQSIAWLNIFTLVNQNGPYRTDYITPSAIICGYGFLAVLFWLLGLLHQYTNSFKKFSTLYTFFGYMGILGFTTFFTSKAGLNFIEDMTSGLPFTKSWQLALMIYMLFISNLLLILYLYLKKGIDKLTLIFTLIPYTLFSILILLPEQTLFLKVSYSNVNLNSAGVFWAVLFNIIVILLLAYSFFVNRSKEGFILKNLGYIFLFTFSFIKFINAPLSNGFTAGTSLIAVLTFLILTISLIYYFDNKLQTQKWQALLTFAGFLPATLFSFFISSEQGLRSFSRKQVVLNYELFNLILLCLFIILLVFILYIYLKDKLTDLLPLLLYLCFLVFLLLSPQGGLFLNRSGSLNPTGILWAIVFNIIAFIFPILTILWGFRYKATVYINIGTILIFLLIFIKYFDWFFTFMDKGIFFIIAGILLFILGAVLEKSRRKFISDISAT
ncbi:MAG: hypothetical protein US60_C0028G0012 [Microgenomates group bacterium GW2011_GWC1_37_8]|uniref:DUF2157 domain-containing protein n=1 Tax=Candidatus Woesebacteria bacterium GW2011_GWB1_38_8 TaxID=1618570 RepID=A0A0G0LA51_9BACT|nr:MAG: hypothetical protein US60_C0028G0012 [Microgenomates group bacterium GW2011_GWC1_37_8]KKQ84725.1 MAG: hypothetical protein UT08_C0014G0017 [Candidatus Woesebacteria bacterium GW2011_GWB1_38_8]